MIHPFNSIFVMSTTTTITPTAAEVQTAAEDYRQAQLHLDKIESDKKAAKAKIDQKYAEVIAERERDLEEAHDTIRAYADANREDLLQGDKKSADLYGLTVGYKLSPLKLTLRRITDNWDNVIERLKQNATTRNYIAVKESVNKTALKKCDPKSLTVLGLKVERTENFTIKL